MARAAVDIYHELLTEEAAIVSISGMAALGATLDEFRESGEIDSPALNAFLLRFDENLNFLIDLYPGG